MTSVYLGLGSNIEPEHNIEQGLVKLRQCFQVQRVSPWYCSKAQGFDGPDFINLVVEIEYDGELAELAQAIKEIEFEFGREAQAVKFASRTLDIDILLFGERSEEHTSELQSRPHLVCRLLLEKKKKKI